MNNDACHDQFRVDRLRMHGMSPVAMLIVHGGRQRGDQGGGVRTSSCVIAAGIWPTIVMNAPRSVCISAFDPWDDNTRLRW